MTRVEAVPEYDRLRLGLGALLAFMVLMSAWLGRVLMLWARYVSGIEAAEGGAGMVAAPALAREREFARLVEARRQASAPQRHANNPRPSRRGRRASNCWPSRFSA